MRKYILPIFLILGVHFSVAQNNKLNEYIEAFTKEAGLSHAGISVSVVDVSTGNLVAAHNANLCLTPASSLKVVTTGAALGILGAAYTFKTELQYDGAIDQYDNLNGNLYIKGFGDPTLASDQLPEAMKLPELLKRFALAVEDAGICDVNGRVVGDGSFFNSAEAISNDWLWEDMGNAYGAGAYGLNFFENFYYLNFQQNNNLGSVPQINGTYPYLPGYSFNNRVVTAANGTGDNATIFSVPYMDEAMVRGTIPAGSTIFTIKGAMPDPPSIAAFHFQRFLKNTAYISFKKSATSLDDLPRGSGYAPRKTLYTHYSPPLRTIVARANQESINLYCESLVRLLGNSTFGGNPSVGIDVVKQFWQGRGVDLDGFFMEDGSGLSVQNAASSFHLASILRVAAQDASLFTDYYESFPKAGETGTIKNMFGGTKAIGHLRAKSGSMTRVRTYTGYFKNPANQLFSFSILVNNYDCSNGEMKRKLEQLMARFCE
ncbi:MAG: D-alanyl-D-alaninecarboxypeptidase/D-alanyl-D-al anine-endopeptidase [Bacteroidota bacterium]|jgi:D-alanyl-D-alanine carboxypeptidase/D-alanyl-D-alanine-endopeptidase (penicillin-binding protein 4)